MEKKMICDDTKAKIKKYLKDFIQGLINEYLADGTSEKKQAASLSSEGGLKPFHEAIVPMEVLRISAFERSLSTKLGSTFEECAFLIAGKKYKEVKRNYKVEGNIPSFALQRIKELTGDSGKMNFLEMVNKLLCDLNNNLLSNTNSSSQLNEQMHVKVIADLYCEGADGNEFFFEIKSPKPNKGQCLEVTERLLTIHALRRESRPKIKAYFAMPYNPYGSKREDYKHEFSCKYLDMDNQVLLGPEFWSQIGEEVTYHELLNIYAEVGSEIKVGNEIQKLISGIDKSSTG